LARVCDVLPDILIWFPALKVMDLFSVTTLTLLTCTPPNLTLEDVPISCIVFKALEVIFKLEEL
jgi:hypothetical protein